jgi:hypothetical protein
VSDLIDNKAIWDVLVSVNKLFARADTSSEVLSVEKKLHYEIRCIAAAFYGDKFINDTTGEHTATRFKE